MQGAYSSIKTAAAASALAETRLAPSMTASVELGISEKEYFLIHLRPGSPVAMGQYGPYNPNIGPVTEMVGIRPRALEVGARTLGTTEAVPQYVRDLGPDAIVWWEKKYLYEAEHIWFWRTGYESKTATPITMMELEEIYNNPLLRNKTSEMWLPESELFKPILRKP
jgi:hypothetical protein